MSSIDFFSAASESLLFLAGPTAAGKTRWAVELVERYPFEIISVDSAQIYREMNIGTAKPEPELLERAPHHLIDILDPTERYSAARFVADAHREMVAIRSRGKIPLLVGGTMLYYRALQFGLSQLPESDPEVRQRLQQWQQEEGLMVLYQRLQQVDPEAAARIQPSDPQRILRALEVYEMTGESLTSHWQRQQDHATIPPAPKLIAVAPPDRALLHRRIEQRAEQMVATGLVEEVAQLRRRGDLSAELPSMRAVGYRQVWEHLEGHSTIDEMLHSMVVATRQLAKRQLTWLRNWPTPVCWVDPDGGDPLQALIRCVR